MNKASLQRHVFLEQLVEVTDQGVWLIGPDGVSLDVNPAMCRLLGRDRDTALSGSIFDFVDDENRKIFERELAARAAGKHASRYEIALQHPDGTLVSCINNANSIWDETGERIGSIGIWTDITEIKLARAELAQMHAQLEDCVAEQTAALRRSEGRLREAHRVARLGSWDASLDGGLVWSDETFEIFGVNREDFAGDTSRFYQSVHPEDRDRVKRESDYAWDHLDHYTTDHRIIRPDGEIRHVRESAAVLRDDDGQTRGLSGVVQDITDQVNLDAQLRQAQKMETIGQLSGGVAHDFNNILAVVMGAAGLLEMEGQSDPELLESIIRSAKRGSELTNRLLAYARKQPLRTAQFDVEELIEGMTGMLSRVLGPDIRLRFEPSKNAGLISADPSPLEDALLNLTVNARDAMPEGGTISVRCERVESANAEGEIQDFVKLVVEDTGSGMPPEVLAQATDPFFTTKSTGKGTGLGLSMIDGYVRQSGGKLEISSVEDEGTCIALYLPSAKTNEPTLLDLEGASFARGNGETVLVLDDNEELTKLVVRHLGALNYRPLWGATAQDAWAAVGRSGGVDVILTDIMLADGARGPRIAAEIQERYPATRLIYMTGYASKTQGPGEEALAEVPVLNKPFSHEALARTLHQTLDTDSPLTPLS